MHRPPTEHQRSSHLTRVPILSIGPSEEFVNELYAVGGRLMHLHKPAPASLRVMRPKLATATARQPWRWSHFWFGVGMGILLGISVAALCVAAAVALVLLPFFYGATHAR